MMRLLAGLLTVGLAVNAAYADDYLELFEEATEAIYWDFADDWAFTESRLVDGVPWVARFDPRKAVGDHWTLISVDGRAPKKAELRDFADDKEDEDSSGNRYQLEIVDTETLELIAESDEHWDFTFVPDDDDFVDNVDSVLRIRKEGPYLESIDMRNRADVEAGFGTRISTFVLQMQFGPAVDGGPIVPHGLKVKLAGRALLFIGFDEHELVSYRDFDYAGPDSNGTQ